MTIKAFLSMVTSAVLRYLMTTTESLGSDMVVQLQSYLNFNTLGSGNIDV